MKKYFNLILIFLLSSCTNLFKRENKYKKASNYFLVKFQLENDFSNIYNLPYKDNGLMMFYLVSLQNDCSTDEKEVILEALLNFNKWEVTKRVPRDENENLSFTFLEMIKKVDSLDKIFMNFYYWEEKYSPCTIIKEILNNKREDLKELMIKTLIDKTLKLYGGEAFGKSIFLEKALKEGTKDKYTYFLHLICMLKDENYVINLLKSFLKANSKVEYSYIKKIINLKDSEGKKAYEKTTSAKVKNFFLNEIEFLMESNNQKFYHGIGNQKFDKIIEKINNKHTFTIKELDILIDDIKNGRIELKMSSKIVKFLENIKSILVEKSSNISSKFIKGLFVLIYFPKIESTGKKEVDEKFEEEGIFRKINDQNEVNTWRAKEVNEILKQLNRAEDESESRTVLFYESILKCLEKDN